MSYQKDYIRDLGKIRKRTKKEWLKSVGKHRRNCELTGAQLTLTEKERERERRRGKRMGLRG